MPKFSESILQLVLVLVVVAFAPAETSRLVKRACRHVPYPERCVSSILSYRPAMDSDIIHAAFNVTMESAHRAQALALGLQNNIMNGKEGMAWRGCDWLFEDTKYRLNDCMSKLRKGSPEKDVSICLSQALTNQRACLQILSDMNLTQAETANYDGDGVWGRATDLLEHASNALALYKAISGSLTLKGRRLLSGKYKEMYSVRNDGFADWLSSGERRLLQSSNTAINANVSVAKEGRANYNTISAAVENAPQMSTGRYVIYVKAGVYEENVVINASMTNLMLIGDGIGVTVLTGNKNAWDGVSNTFTSCTLCAAGNGFIARDMTIENTSGLRTQAVALQVQADKAVLYRVNISGYQDTLCVFSGQQFYREAHIYGTVDFIFGNAAAVIQDSTIYARLPLWGQANIIAAHGRSMSEEETGFIFHNCKVIAAPDLQPFVGSVKTFLGRPWRPYSRIVFMESQLGNVIDPAGWTDVATTSPLSTLYFAEFNNHGPGALTTRRVNWPGYHILTSSQAFQFTVDNFITGQSWIPSTRVPYA